MWKSGWTILPAAFFFLLNLSAAEARPAFFFQFFYFVFFILLFFLLRRFDLKNIVRSVTFGSSVILFVYGIAQKFLLFPLYLQKIGTPDNPFSRSLSIRIRSGRIFSIFTLPTLYAIVCAILIILLLHYFLRAAKYRIAWLILMLLGLFNLMLTESYGGILYLTVGLVCYLLFTGILHIRLLAPVMMVLVLFFSIITVSRYSEARKLDPLKLRLTNWNQAVRMIRSSPVTGIGLGNYPARIAAFTYPGEARSVYAHNFFLQLGAETGLFAWLLLAALLWHLYKTRNPHILRKKPHFAAAAVSLLLYNLIDIGFFFFSAALLGTVMVSQLFRKPGRHSLRPAVPLLIFGIVLLLQSVSAGHLHRGQVLFSQNSLKQAAAEYRTSLRFNPFNTAALSSRGYICLLQKSISRADTLVARSLAYNSAAPFSNYLMSRIRFAQQRYSDALYFAALAVRGNRLKSSYKKWHEYIRNSFTDQKTSF